MREMKLFFVNYMETTAAGGINTVGRRPFCPVVVRTIVASRDPSSRISERTDTRAPRASRARLTSISPRTVANVCRRSEVSAHW